MTPTSTGRATPSMRWTASTDELLRFERLLSELSAGFIDMPAAQIDAAIVDALRRIVELLGIDRSTLSLVVPESDLLDTFHSWAVDGVQTVRKGIIPRPLPWVLGMARARRPIVFSRLADLPAEAGADREWYARNGLRSHVGLPVLVAGELFAVLGFGVLRTEREWPSELVERLKLVGDMFGGALARKRAHEDIERALGFERLLADISASLVTQPLRDLDRALEGAVRAIGAFLGVDHVSLWRCSDDGARFERSHHWIAEAARLPPPSVDELALPYVFRSLASGRVISIPSVDRLPPDAEVDRSALHDSGTQSLLAVPLTVAGLVVGALSLATVVRRRDWPDALIPRVRLMGEVFASVLTRQRAAVEVQKAQSETAQYRERLAHLVRVHTVSEMSAAIAHEVNQPLMAIENYAQAAARRLDPSHPVDGAKLQELLGKIGLQAARAGDVLKRLRSIVKKHESEASVFDMNALVAETMTLVEMESRLQDVRIEVHAPQGVPHVYADAIQVQQVLLNLARNGIEAMDALPPSDKLLRVEVSAPAPGQVRVRVIDRGRGLSEEDAAHLFEPFYSTKPQGLGIGLAICRSIIEAHGGKLACLPSPDEGTVFQFTLPVDAT